MLIALALFALAFSAAGYAWLGSRDGWRVPAGGAAAFVASLPHEQANAWLALARIYSAQGRLAEAVPAWRRVIELRPGDAQSHADAADAIASASGAQALDGEPEQLLHKALALDPDNLKALVLAGRAAIDRGDAQTAARHWQRALLQVESNSAFARELKQALAVVGVAAAPHAAASAPAAGATVHGQVALSASLAGSVSPDDTVFVFARAEGGKAPLAVLRKKASDLPFAFTLDDSMAMSPALRLSSAERVVVGARISRSGSALPQAGDLQTLSSPVAIGTRGVRLEIADVVR